MLCFLFLEDILVTIALRAVLSLLILVVLSELSFLLLEEVLSILKLAVMSFLLSLQIFSVLLVKSFHLCVLGVTLFVVVVLVICPRLVPLLLTLVALIFEVSDCLVTLVQLVLMSLFLGIACLEV